MRLGVITRMFTYRPRDLSSVQTTLAREDVPRVEAEITDVGKEAKPAAAAQTSRAQTSSGKKKSAKRRRRRRRR